MPVGPQRRQTSYLNMNARGMPGRPTSNGVTKLMGVTTNERRGGADPLIPLMGSTNIVLGGMRPDAPLVGASKRKRAQERAEPRKTTILSPSTGGATIDRRKKGTMGEIIGGSGKPAGKLQKSPPLPPITQHKRTSLGRDGMMGLTYDPKSRSNASLIGITGFKHGGPVGPVRKGTPDSSGGRKVSGSVRSSTKDIVFRGAPLRRSWTDDRAHPQSRWVKGAAGPARTGQAARDRRELRERDIEGYD